METGYFGEESHDETEPPSFGPSLDLERMMNRRAWGLQQSFDDTIEYMKLVQSITDQQSYADMMADREANSVAETHRNKVIEDRGDQAAPARRFGGRVLSWLLN